MGPSGEPYVTPAQLVQYVPRAVLNLATMTQQTQACIDASEEADSYMRGRYQMPLLAWGADVTRYTAAIAIYNLVDGPIGWAAMAGSDRNIRALYARALGGPDPDNHSFIHPGWFPGIQRQNIQPDVTPSVAVGQSAVYDLPQVSSLPPRNWQRGNRIGGV